MVENKGKLAKEINETIRYTMWSVFKLDVSSVTTTVTAEAAEVDDLIEKLAGDDVVVRGTYDVSGLRADADLMIWWHSADRRRAAGGLQRLPAHRARLAHGAGLVADGACTARPSSTSRTSRRSWPTSPASPFVCVYPFVRSYEWYLLPDEERRDMLQGARHAGARLPGRARQHGRRRSALGDYEWILAFEADVLHRIVDLMRELRASRARRHVREEIPFYTGRAHTMTELISLWP